MTQYQQLREFLIAKDIRFVEASEGEFVIQEPTGTITLRLDMSTDSFKIESNGLSNLVKLLEGLGGY